MKRFLAILSVFVGVAVAYAAPIILHYDGAPSDGQVPQWSTSQSKWIPATVSSSSSGGVTDHGALTGLADDDHTQYHTDARALTWLGTRSTSDLPEGSNLYYTDERADDREAVLTQNGTGLTWTYNDGANTLTGNVSLSPFSTTNLSEGTNLYYTAARFNTAFGGKTTTDLAEGTNLYYTAARFNTAFAAKTTSDLTEGSNLYYTDERNDDRTDALILDGAGITTSYNDGAGTLTISSSITQYTDEESRDAIAAFIQNGTGISWSHNDGANTLTPTISLSSFSTTNLSEGSNLYFTNERAQDTVGGALSDSGRIDFTYTDGSDLITADIVSGSITNTYINASAAIAYSKLNLAGLITSSDITDGTIVNADINSSAAIALSKLATDPLARANHTGTQTASTISDFTEAAQDATGAMATNSSNVTLTYADATPALTADLVNTAVTPGSYTSADITIDAKGRVTAAANGASGSSNWTDTGTLLHPADLSGAEDVAVGGTTTAAPILLKGASGNSGTASFSPTSAITNPPHSLVIDEATTNLVTDPSAEGAFSIYSAQGSNSTVTNDLTTSFCGAESIKTVISPATASSGFTTSAITVSSSTNYVFSLYVKGNAGGEAVTLRVDPNSSTNADRNFLLTTDWKRIYVAKTTSVGDSSVQLQLITTAGTAPTFFSDCLQLEAKTSHPTSYTDGSLGPGNAFTGSAHASTSTRVAGLNLLAPITAGSSNPFILRPDGFLGVNKGGIVVESTTQLASAFYNFTFKANQSANALFSEGPFRFYNEGNGNALWVTSNTTDTYGAVIEAPYVTTGSIFGLAAPADKTNFSGEYFEFLDKSGLAKKDWRWNKNRMAMGDVAENLDKYIVMKGGGAYATTATNQTAGSGITSSGVTVTGVGTNFDPEFAIGDVIVISGQYRVVRTRPSDTSLTTTVAFNPAISGNPTPAKLNAQYSPPTIFFEGPDGDHKASGYADQLYALFANGNDRPKWMQPTRVAGTGTLSATSGAVGYTTSSANVGITAGDIIIPVGHAPFVVQTTITTSSGDSRTSFASTLSAVAFEYIDTNTTTLPTSNTSGQYLVSRQTRATDTVTTTANQTEQSILSSTINIPAGRMGTDGGLRVTYYGTLAAGNTSRTLSWLTTLGGSAVTTSVYETLGVNDIYSFECVLTIQNTATNAQKNVNRCTARPDANNTGASTAEVWVTYSATAIDTTKDNALDLRVDYNTNNGSTIKEMVIIEEL